MRHRRGWLLVVWVLVTVAVYAALVLVTGFVACGVSGCSGAGFGPAFAPVQAQVGLLSAGLCLVPLAAFLLRGRRRASQVVGVVGAVLIGSLLAMVVLRLGPNGCPWGYSRTAAGPDAFSPGSPTCTAAGEKPPG
jgi:hypothetical protein